MPMGKGQHPGSYGPTFKGTASGSDEKTTPSMPVPKGQRTSKDVEDVRTAHPSDFVPIWQKDKRLDPPEEKYKESDEDYMRRAAKSYRDRTRPDAISAGVEAIKAMGFEVHRSDRPWEDSTKATEKDWRPVGRKRRR